MRVVLDTNVLISAFLWQGTPKELFVLAQKNEITICITKELAEEFERVLSYPKFQERLTRIGKTPQGILDEFLEVIEYFPSFYFPTVQIKPDPSDDIFLAGALSSGASFIISGDQHLLNLKKFQNIPIVTPRQFLTQVKKKRS